MDIFGQVKFCFTNHIPDIPDNIPDIPDDIPDITDIPDDIPDDVLNKTY